jgi:hypothetical protein
MRCCGFVLVIGLACAGGAAAQPVDGRWTAEERCAGRATGRTYILTVDGRGLTARLAGANLESFGSILGATVLLPNDSFLIDIPVTGADSKVTYTGRFNPVGRSSASGGLWEGSRHTACTLSIARLGAPGGGSGKPTVSAGRPEPIPGLGAGAPATQGPDGVWRREGAAAPDISSPPPRRQPDPPVGRLDPVPPSTPVARPTPAPTPPASPPPAAGNSEVEALRRQLEEERRRRAMAESAMRLQEELRRQGGAAPAQ